MIALGCVHHKFELLGPIMNEKLRRRWAACEALSLGRGGISAVAGATGLSRTTIRRGIAELKQQMPQVVEQVSGARIREPGGGRRSLSEHDPTLLEDLERAVASSTRGDPISPLLWTSKSTRHLARVLAGQGHQVSHMTVARLLHELGYSLQGNRKTQEGRQHPDRDAQFEHINRTVRQFHRRRQPVISVDTKKRELVGNFKNAGREWRPSGMPEEVRMHDFRDPQLGVAIPHGVYDTAQNEGWVSVGIDHDTAEFAAETLRRWWWRMGSRVYPEATELLITADAGGSNSARSRLWKLRLQSLADETGLTIHVCHFPPGTSKWNKIEHRMFCHITENWRGRPLTSRAVIVDLIGHSGTSKGLKVHAELDEGTYNKGIKVSDSEMATIHLTRSRFHGEWNYKISPAA